MRVQESNKCYRRDGQMSICPRTEDDQEHKGKARLRENDEDNIAIQGESKRLVLYSFIHEMRSMETANNR